MHKIVERLTEKYLMKDIRRITLQVYTENFDRVFNECCESTLDNNTTIGSAFKKIEDLAYANVLYFMCSHLDKIGITSSPDNPFYGFLDTLWDEANEYLSFKDCVSSILDDERHDKETELFKAGILDFDGDYMKQEILEVKLNA